MTFNLLDDLDVLDFTTRLPGPFSSFILAHLGANVTKLEDLDHNGDAFSDPAYLQHTPHFLDWYQNLNDNKRIQELSFSRDQDKVATLIKEAQIILIPDSRFFKEYIHQFELDQKVVIRLAGGKDEWRSLHDLNALALTKSFNFHLQETQTPPYLPIAGINYGHFLASFSLAALRKVEKNTETEPRTIEETLYLKDITESILDVFYSELTTSPHRFLHNGSFPCYQVYTTKDGQFACFAGIEEKFWRNFQKVFGIKLELDDRFDLSGKTEDKIQKLFAKLYGHEVEALITNDMPICLTLVSKLKC